MLAALAPIVNAPATYAFVVVFGLVWGSFANVCIYRWPPTDDHPDGHSVVHPGSHCGACQAPIKWYDNVPILSYLWLRGRCRACGVGFSPRYLIVEAVTGALFGVAWWFTMGTGGYGTSLDHALVRFAIDAAFVFVMVVITFIDLDHKLILDKVTLPSIAVFYAATFALPGVPWWRGLAGAAIGYGVVWVIGAIYHAITKRDGLGLGDGKLLAVVGALMGWRGVVFALFGGSLAGSVIGTIALVVSRRRAPAEPPPVAGDEDASAPKPPSMLRVELPFGPFLAVAALFYLFAEPWIWLNLHLPGE